MTPKDQLIKEIEKELKSTLDEGANIDHIKANYNRGLYKAISTIKSFLKDYELVENSEWRERWIYLSLFKCPNCNSKRVFGKPLDTKNIHDLHQIMVCCNCGWNKIEKVDTSDMRGKN